jgi:signal transduction histidine kinase
MDKARTSMLGALLRWFVRLRWLAGFGLVMVGLLDWGLLHWYARSWAGTAVGAAVLAYNAAVAVAVNRLGQSRRALVSIAWVQILLDVVALTLLTVWTGGAGSPFLPLFVLHMVFASLLLPRAMAYGGAGATVAILLMGLGVSGQWPTERGLVLRLVAWAGALVATVFVGRHIARSLRRQRRRLIRQNRRILSMSRRLRRQQRALIQQEKMVALGQMASGVAHEIANPLASMDSLLQLMLRKPERAGSESIEKLRALVERMGNIVRELTTFARPTDAQWETLSVNAVVEEALGLVGHDRRVGTVAVERELSPTAGELAMLPQAMQQVLVNLLRNALDATAAGVASPRIRVRTGRQDEWVVIEVSDNGHGIEPRNLRRLFEPFFTTKPVGQGTGLGLSISYSIVRRHGGLITVRSRPGEGATFVVKIPAARKGAPAIGV